MCSQESCNAVCEQMCFHLEEEVKRGITQDSALRGQHLFL